MGRTNPGRGHGSGPLMPADLHTRLERDQKRKAIKKYFRLDRKLKVKR